MKSSEIYHKFGISPLVIETCLRAEEELLSRFNEIDKVSEFNFLKILLAMQEEKVSLECMGSTSGYGIGDIGRDTLEKVYARIFKSDAAIIRPQLISGTNALYITLSGLLKAGENLISPCGLPYDTLQSVIGIIPQKGSLKEFGIDFNYADLTFDGFDFDAVSSIINDKTKLCLIQRSRGYSGRKALGINDIREIVSFIKGINKDIICLVDNCYGEYTDFFEPIEAGADIAVGSLIKNAGGGIAPIGGYIAGRNDLIKLIFSRLTAPGLGNEEGASLGINRLFYQGTFLAPLVTASSLKGALLASKVYNDLGFRVSPLPFEKQGDTVAMIELGSRERVISFCRGIQRASAVDSFADPIPSPMPGYSDEVIMASGSFISGSSAELSADAPLRPPYRVFLQGSLSYAQARLGVMMSLEALAGDGLVSL